MPKFIKQNLLVIVISGAVSSIITLFLIFVCHVKTWGVDEWNAFFNFFISISTIALATVGCGAYKNYWRQKKESTIYERIINSTSLMHTEMLQLRSYINNYASSIILHLNGAQPEPITISYLNDLIYETNNCLSYIKGFNNNITNWQSELDYIYLFTKSIEKEIDIADLEIQFNKFNQSITNSLFRQIIQIKQRLKTYVEQAVKDNLNSVMLPVSPISILMYDALETEAKIKEFIESVIKAFS